MRFAFDGCNRAGLACWLIDKVERDRKGYLYTLTASAENSIFPVCCGLASAMQTNRHLVNLKLQVLALAVSPLLILQQASRIASIKQK